MSCFSLFVKPLFPLSRHLDSFLTGFSTSETEVEEHTAYEVMNALCLSVQHYVCNQHTLIRREGSNSTGQFLRTQCFL